MERFILIDVIIDQYKVFKELYFFTFLENSQLFSISVVSSWCCSRERGPTVPWSRQQSEQYSETPCSLQHALDDLIEPFIWPMSQSSICWAHCTHVSVSHIFCPENYDLFCKLWSFLDSRLIISVGIQTRNQCSRFTFSHCNDCNSNNEKN